MSSNIFYFAAYQAGAAFVNDATATGQYTTLTGSAPVTGSIIIYEQVNVDNYVYRFNGTVWAPLILTGLTAGTSILTFYTNGPNQPTGNVIYQTGVINSGGDKPTKATLVQIPQSFCAAVDDFSYEIGVTTQLAVDTAYTAYTGISPPAQGALYLVDRTGSTSVPAGKILLVYAELNNSLQWQPLNIPPSAVYSIFDPVSGSYYTYTADTTPYATDLYELQNLYQSQLCVYTAPNLTTILPDNLPDGAYLLNTTNNSLYIKTSGPAAWTLLNPQPAGKYVVNSSNTGEILLVNPLISNSPISSCLALEQAMLLKYTQRDFTGCDNPLGLFEDVVTYHYQTISECSISTLPLPIAPSALPVPALLGDYTIQYQNATTTEIQFSNTLQIWQWANIEATQVATVTYWLGGQKHTAIYTLAFIPAILRMEYFCATIDCSSVTPVTIATGLAEGATLELRCPSTLDVPLTIGVSGEVVLQNPNALAGSGRVVYEIIATNIQGFCVKTIYDITITCLPAPAEVEVNFFAGITNNSAGVSAPGSAILTTPFITGLANPNQVNLNDGNNATSPYIWNPMNASFGTNIDATNSSNGIFLPLFNGTGLYKVNAVVNYEYPAQVCKQSGVCPKIALMKRNGTGPATMVACGVVSLNKISSMSSCTDSPVARGQVIIDGIISMTNDGTATIAGNDNLYLAYENDGLYIPITLNPDSDDDLGCQTTFSAFLLD